MICHESKHCSATVYHDIQLSITLILSVSLYRSVVAYHACAALHGSETCNGKCETTALGTTCRPQRNLLKTLSVKYLAEYRPIDVLRLCSIIRIIIIDLHCILSVYSDYERDSYHFSTVVMLHM